MSDSSFPHCIYDDPSGEQHVVFYGHATDAATRDPLGGVFLSATPSRSYDDYGARGGNGTSTDDGCFEFQAYPAPQNSFISSFDVKAEKRGYFDQTQEEPPVRGGEAIEMNFQLEAV